MNNQNKEELLNLFKHRDIALKPYRNEQDNYNYNVQQKHIDECINVFIDKIIQETHNKAIDSAIEALPVDWVDSDELKKSITIVYGEYSPSPRAVGHNTCREQAKQNLTKLKI